MVKRLLLGLLLIPLLDALFLVYVASQLGAALTVALVVLTALVGTLFVRAEGRHTVRKLQRTLAEGEVPADELTDGALLIAAGAFLLTPGLVTDTVGFLLAFPPSRILVREAVQKWVVKPYLDEKTGGLASGNLYTFGFPNPEDATAGGTAADASGRSRARSEDTYRVDDDAYDIEFDDEKED
ncbi:MULTISPECIES: FxsA family protein [Halorussus]|uniref:FxsA family protein n=1 Tax=Halorussus TaxID=1070314 RepID=UPI0020A1CCD3|nr:FxsA family protein [Halorussus vallis]USZ77031.1 membrane protein FxsA [Halorussus vallis]